MLVYLINFFYIKGVKISAELLKFSKVWLACVFNRIFFLLNIDDNSFYPCIHRHQSNNNVTIPVKGLEAMPNNYVHILWHTQWNSNSNNNNV